MSDSDGDGDDRASRLRNRRNKTREKAQSDTDETVEAEEQSEPSKTDKTDKTSVKDERPAQMMYLPESMQREMNRQFGLLETDFEYEFGEDFEKNRHFFPLLVKAGLDSLDGLDIQEIKDKIDEIEG